MEIKLRTPDGRPSLIRVERIAKGINLFLLRGDYVADIHLPSFAARRIAEAIDKLLDEEPS